MPPARTHLVKRLTETSISRRQSGDARPLDGLSRSLTEGATVLPSGIVSGTADATSIAVTHAESLCDHLLEHVRTTQAARAAIELSDEAGARAAISDARLSGTALRRAQSAAADVRIPLSVEGIDFLLAVNDLSAKIRQAKDAIHAWLSRPLPSPGSLPDSEVRERIVDALLGVEWDAMHDVVILAGADSTRIAPHLLARGQRRIIHLSPGGPGDTDTTQAVLTCCSTAELRSAIANFSDHPPERFAIHRTDDAVPATEDLLEAAREGTEAATANRGTIDSFGPVWVQQGLRNLPALSQHPSIVPLRDAFAGKPAVIVAPGPSLERNISELAAWKGRAVIIAVSHALGSLTHAGIRPDLVIAVDPQDIRYHFTDEGVRGVEALILGATVHPDVLRLPAKRIFTFAGNTALDRWIYEAFGEEAGLHNGGSVSTSAFSLALHLGCDPVVLVGQDLCYPHGRAYAEGCPDSGARMVELEGRLSLAGYSEGYSQLAKVRTGGSPVERRVDVPAIEGGTVPTSFSFLLFLRWFRATATSLDGSRRLLNCTEGGARIDGFEHLPLAEAGTRLAGPAFSVGRILDERLESFDRSRRAAAAHRFAASTERALKNAGRIARQAKTAAAGAARDPAARSRLDRAEKALSDAIRPARFASLLFQKQIRETLTASESATDVHTNLALSARLADLVHETSRALRPELQDAMRQLEPLRHANTLETRP